MTNIVPKSKILSQAVRWISDNRKVRPNAKLVELIGEAAQRFDLSPLESEGLLQTLLAEEDAMKKGGPPPSSDDTEQPSDS